MSGRRLAILVVCTAVALATPSVGVLPATAGGPTVQTVPAMRWLNGVSCRPDRTCLGVGDQPDSGAVVVLTPTGVGPVHRVPGTRSLRAIDCLPTGNCIAVGEGRRGPPVVVELAADGTPLAVRLAQGATSLYDVACPTATTCLATGRVSVSLPDYPYSHDIPVFVVITDGVPAPPQRFPRGPKLIFGIDCPTATRCLAVGPRIVAVLTAGDGSWTVTYGPPGPEYPDYYDFSCATPSACYGIAFGNVPGIVAVSPDGRTGERRALGGRFGNLYGISCVAEWTCTVAGTDHATSRAITIDWSPSAAPVVTLFDDASSFEDVSCIAPGACGMVGAVAGTGPLPPAVWAWKG